MKLFKLPTTISVSVKNGGNDVTCPQVTVMTIKEDSPEYATPKHVALAYWLFPV